jgi:8-oxo-dGTP diphosphatase
VERTVGDGNGWTHCALGHRHWGLFGAAGLLLTDRVDVLLQHRAGWTHEGDTWAVPGGARDSHETVVEAALREAVEETSLDPRTVRPVAAWTDDHCGWSYTTIVAVTTARTAVFPANAESSALRWWAFDDVAQLRLHHGFAAAWPQLRGLIEDAAGAGTRPT